MELQGNIFKWSCFFVSSNYYCHFKNISTIHYLKSFLITWWVEQLYSWKWQLMQQLLNICQRLNILCFCQQRDGFISYYQVSHFFRHGFCAMDSFHDPLLLYKMNWLIQLGLTYQTCYCDWTQLRETLSYVVVFVYLTFKKLYFQFTIKRDEKPNWTWIFVQFCAKQIEEKTSPPENSQENWRISSSNKSLGDEKRSKAGYVVNVDKTICLDKALYIFLKQRHILIAIYNSSLCFSTLCIWHRPKCFLKRLWRFYIFSGSALLVSDAVSDVHDRSSGGYTL